MGVRAALAVLLGKPRQPRGRFGSAPTLPSPNYNRRGPLDGAVIFTLNGSGDPVEVSASNPLSTVPASTYVPQDTVAAGTLQTGTSVRVTVPLAGRQSVGGFIAAGTLAATVIPIYSLDGGVTWRTGWFASVNAGAGVASIVLTNPNAQQDVVILAPSGATHAGIGMSAFTSGAAVATLYATSRAPGTIKPNGDNNPTALADLIAQGVVGTGGVNRVLAGANLSDANAGVNFGGVHPMLYVGATTFDRERTPNVFKPLSAVTINTETTIWTPAAGKKFRLMGFFLVGSAAGNITLKDNTGGTTKLVIPTPAGGAGIPAPPMGNGILSAAANNVLTATGSVNMTLSGFVYGTEE